jgi:hypothetical protein
MEQPQTAVIYMHRLISDIRRDFLVSSKCVREMNAAYKTMIQKGTLDIFVRGFSDVK